MQRSGYMGKRAKSGGGLHIHRETLRSLSPESLKAVAGGDYGIIDDISPCPRTNAWTANVDPIRFDDGSQLCGGTGR